MIYAALLLVVTALFFWLSNFGIVVRSRDWPLLVVLLGLLLLVRGLARGRPRKIIDRLASGKIDADEAVRLLKRGR